MPLICLYCKNTIIRFPTSQINFHYFFLTGKMFKSAELPWLITFFQMFYNDKPVDWLLEHLIYTKVCNWEKDMVSCIYKKPKKISFIENIVKVSTYKVCVFLSN